MTHVHNEAECLSWGGRFSYNTRYITRFKPRRSTEQLLLHLPMPPTGRPPAQLVRRDAFSRFICPSCAFSRTLITNKVTVPSRQTPQLNRPSRRHASTVASATAINAPVDVPIAFKDLHESLQKLKNDAAVYTNLSRLQLALRGLESRNAVVRVAGTKPRAPKSANIY